MKTNSLVNLVAYVLALVLAAIGVILVAPRTAEVVVSTATLLHTVRDARGAVFPIRPYQRVVTLDLLSDELAGRLLPLSRLIGVSGWAQDPEAWRLAGIPRMAGLSDLESLLVMKPDLILVSTSGTEIGRIQRLRDAGIAVFNLGPAGGTRELCANIRRVSLLLGVGERGEQIAAQFERRLSHVSTHLPSQMVRRRALVLTPTVIQVYGGTTGSSFHDLVLAAGLIDAAEGHFAEPWPLISAEQALTLDPDIIVTRRGGVDILRRIPGFDRLRALHTPDAAIELPEALFDSPGLSVLDAAERLCDAAYPDARRN
ncbi:MAG: ABC transporter substrate-binding protein [Planctomycetota bacterium]